MSIYVTIVCDRCRQEHADAPPVSNAKRGARDAGWRIGKEHVCYDCRYNIE